MRTATLGARLWLAGLRGALQYRTDTLIIVVMALVFQGTGFAFAWVVLTRFEAIGGWSLGEIAFLYGLRLIVHAVAGVLAGPFFGLEWQVRSGQFDRYLVRPVSPLLQFMTQSVQVSVLGDLLGGLAIFLAANALIDVAWTLPGIAFLLLAVVGGALVELATRILIGAVTFKTLTSAPLMFPSDSVFSTYANYPLSIFGSILAWIFTFLIPLAPSRICRRPCCSTAPRSYTLRRRSRTSLPWRVWCGWQSPPGRSTGSSGITRAPGTSSANGGMHLIVGQVASPWDERLVDLQCMEPQVRYARRNDVDELARLRWNMHTEEEAAVEDYDAFLERFRVFAETAVDSGSWRIWVAEQDRRIVANLWLHLVARVASRTVAR